SRCVGTSGGLADPWREPDDSEGARQGKPVAEGGEADLPRAGGDVVAQPAQGGGNDPVAPGRGRSAPQHPGRAGGDDAFAPAGGGPPPGPHRADRRRRRSSSAPLSTL